MTPPTHTTPRTLIRRAGRTNPKAAALAAASAVLLASLVGIIAWRNRGSATTKPPVPAQPSVPDIRDLPSLTGRPGEGPASAAVGKGKGFFAQYVDRDDRTRLAGEITADRSEPLPDHRYELTQPRAWFFQKDGRSIHVQADKGRVTTPAENAQPTDGSIEGNVRIRLFAATPGGARPDLATATPELDLTTSRVSVDWALGQLDMPEEVAATSPRLDFRGRNISAQFDPATHRLDQLHVASLVKPVVIRMHEDPKPQTRANAAAEPVQQTTTQAADHTDPPPPAEERFYTLTASESVELRQGERTARADEVLAWARMLGNSFTGIAAGGPDATRPQASQAASAATQSQPPATGERPLATSPTPKTEDISLSWKGPLFVQRIEDRPPQLERDDAIIQLSAAGTAVTLEDTPAGLSARGTRLQYAATRESITFTGTPASPATVTMAGAGNASAAAFEIDSRSAIVRVPGAGSLTSARAETTAPDATSTIAWSEQAEFHFDSLKGKSSALRRAVIVGNVTGGQGGLSIAADSATAEFFPPAAGAHNEQRNLIKTVQLVGRATARDTRPDGGALKGDTIHVSFDPPATDAATPAPRRVEATGHASAARGEESLTAGTITATLSPRQAGADRTATRTTTDAEVETIDATGGFSLTGKDRLAASGETLHVRVPDHTARLAGAPAAIEQQGARLRGQILDLDGSQSTVIATGPGDFARTPPENAPGSPLIEASWSRSMALNDTAGTLAIDGDARFRSATGADAEREESSVRADAVRVSFEHASKDEGKPAPPPTQGNARPLVAGLPRGAGGERRVLTAEGTSPDEANPVRLEVRRGVPRVAEGRTLYVEGQRITADNTARTIHVPGAGKLLNSDRRPDLELAQLPDAGARTTQDASLPGSSKGDALFIWKKDATLDLAAGQATLDGSVRMVHRRLADSALTELECDHLTASIEEDLRTRRLSSVRADGNVWARSQGREMTSQLAIYNAPLGILEATGGDVLVSDPRAGEPLNARAIRWNLATGRIEIIDPGAISGPR